MMDIQDAPQRRAALDPKRSFICEAPAGSGKTELLSQRFLTLLSTVDDPEEVVAITFTRKAAAEMRQRILRALQQAQHEAQPETEHGKLTWRLASAVLERNQQKQWHLLDNPNRLRISTFDSLCASLTRSLPLTAALGGQLDVVDNPEELYQQTVQQLIQEIDRESPWQQALVTLLKQHDNQVQRVEQFLIQMLAQRGAWLPLLGKVDVLHSAKQQLESHLQHTIDDHIALLRDLIPQHFHAPLLHMASYAAAQLRRLQRPSPIHACLDIDLKTQLPSSDPDGVQQWRGLRYLLLTKNDGYWRKSVNIKLGFPVDGHGREKFEQRQQRDDFLQLLGSMSQTTGLCEALQELDFLPDPHYDSQQWEGLNAIVTLLPYLAAHLQLTFRAHNGADFTEISQRASQALGSEDNPTDLALRLDYQIRHILVDEFQDTSFNQYELIQKLVAGWENGDGRSLFVVGDAMQSIYSFRNANVGLFLHCKENGIGQIQLTPLQLNTNFRSQAGIVHWNNRAFAKAFPSRQDIPSGAVTFAPANPVKETLADKAVRVHYFCRDASEFEEARIVLGIIRKTLDDNPSASIAILVRNRSHLRHIVPLLQQHQVRFQALDIEPLADQSVVMDLMCLCKALLAPQELVAWLSVLRAPWCGLSLADLHALRQRPQEDSISHTFFEQIQQHLAQPEEDTLQASDLFGTAADDGQRLSADGEKRLARVWPILMRGLAERQRKPLREWLQGIWLRLGGPACLADEQALKNTERFFDLLEELDKGSNIEILADLDEAVQQLYAAPDPEADPRLQIMTIHQAKGLEFDTVIVPSLQRQPRNNDTSLLLSQERLRANGAEELLLAPAPAQGEKKPSSYVHLQKCAQKRERFEQTRLLYVACSRAKERLHLLAQIKPSDSNPAEYKSPPQASLLHSIWSAAKPTKIYQEAFNDAKPTSSYSAQSQQVLNRLPVDWQCPELPKENALEAYVMPADYDNETEQPQALWSDPTPRHVGTVVHQILLEMSVQGLEHWHRQRIADQQALRRAQLVQLGVPRHALDEANAEVTRLAFALLDDDDIAWMLKHPQRQAEFPVSTLQFGETQALSIDLLLLDVNGETRIIDFKTSSPHAGQSPEDFIQQELAQYQGIMHSYRRAVSDLGYPRVRCSLYFPAVGLWGHYSL